MIEHNKPTISSKDRDLVTKVLESGWLASGENVPSFEAQFAQLYGLSPENVVAVSSGSAALFLALMALDARGKRVAIPAYSCSSLENAVQLAGAKTVYIDASEESFNMNQSLIEPDNLVIHPHMFGYPSFIDNKWSSQLIEDCAQSIGSILNGKLTGLQGELGVFSFYATKLLTTAGQGGMVISKNPDYINFIKDFIEFDQKTDGKKRFNFAMSEIQAAMGRNQLTQLFETFIPKRQIIFKKYLSTGMNFYEPKDKRIKPVNYRVLLKVSHPIDAINFLKGHKISSIIPVSECEILGGCESDLPVAFKHARSWISIPCYPTLTDEIIEKICKTLEKMKDFN